jgi:hypothetical protein
MPSGRNILADWIYASPIREGAIRRFSMYIMAYTLVSMEAYTESYVKPVVALWERCFQLWLMYILSYTLNSKCEHIHDFS